jgi:hypothetical protein
MTATLIYLEAGNHERLYSFSKAASSVGMTHPCSTRYCE